MLQDVARLTGGKAITEDLDIPLRNIRISDIGQAKKITIDKNNTVVEGRVKYDPRSSAYSNSGALLYSPV
jgi:chaperonin GroEL (HSP60 family)